MRKIYSLLLGLLCISTASAQSWTEPAVPTEGSDPISGRVYRVKNTEEGLYLAYGTVWFGWNTTAMLVDPEAMDPLSFTLTEEFDEEGIQKLADLAGEDLQNLVDRIRALKEADGRYINFGGILPGKTGSVRFIIETDEIKK